MKRTMNEVSGEARRLGLGQGVGGSSVGFICGARAFGLDYNAH